MPPYSSRAIVGQRRDEGRQQIAVRAVQLEHVEAAALRHRGGRDELLAHHVHVGAVHRLRRLIVRRPRDVRRRHHRPVAVLQRRVHLLPAELGRALRRRNGRAGSRSSRRSRDARNRRCASTPPRARAHTCRCSRAMMRPSGRHAGHLGVDEARAALGALAVVDEVPVGRAAVDRLVLRHRRDDDAVLQRQVAQLERREHRAGAPGRWRSAGLLLEPRLGALQPVLVAQAQILVADALRAGQQRIVELHRIEMEIALDLLEPFQRIARRRLQPQHFDPARVLVFLEGRLHGRLAVQVVGERDGALHRELGARADGEMRGRRRVAHAARCCRATMSRTARAEN